jgi:hypothetical protein
MAINLAVVMSLDRGGAKEGGQTDQRAPATRERLLQAIDLPGSTSIDRHGIFADFIGAVRCVRASLRH